MGKMPPPIEIHEEELGHYISKSSRKKGRPALNQPLQSKYAGGGTPLLRLTRTSETKLIELPMNPRISTFAVSDVPLLDIHKVAQIEVAHRFLLCPVVGSTGRYKPARSDPCWVSGGLHQLVLRSGARLCHVPFKYLVPDH
ncbi:hypothetical protein J6590_071275 [Homalodisca vitripennis]|nr:hypothetical protein J6590_071275 [Homalodisca vitripennis]